MIRKQAVDLFAVPLGRMCEKLVGPHPMWSCQLGASPDHYTDLLPWPVIEPGHADRDLRSQTLAQTLATP